MKLLSSIHKEMLLLVRDKAGLAVLFVMPLALVTICALVQEESFKAVKDDKRSVLFVNEDSGAFGTRFEEYLESSQGFEVVKSLGGEPVTEDIARRQVAEGRFQVCVVVADGMTEAAETRAAGVVQQAFDASAAEDTWDFGAESAPPEPEKKAEPPAEPVTGNHLRVYFDPTVGSLYRKSLTNALMRVAQGIEMEAVMRAFVSRFPEEVSRRADEVMEELWDESLLPEISADDVAWEAGTLLGLEEKVAAEDDLTVIPTSVQQNVPAWAMFAMFFVVIPLSGSVIKEREGGTLLRLRTLPVSPLTILLAKVTVYVAVCLIQFVLMLGMGKTVLPMLGTPMLVIGTRYGAIALIAAASALAATGFGMLVGTVARTHEQASVFGATSVVIMSALGGVMVPIFLMPRVMQRVSVVSPPNWGLTAFLDVFVRNHGVLEVLPGVTCLTLFFGVTMAAAVASFLRWE